MPVRQLSLLAAAAILAAGAPARASQPPPDMPPASSDPDNTHVYKFKPWKAKFAYRVRDDAKGYVEANSRSGAAAQLIRGHWVPIDCQLKNVTQNGPVLWNHVPNVGFVADKHISTYTDDPLPNAPTCVDPGANHVWFEQPWAPDKQYRAKVDAPVYTRPAGAVRPDVHLPAGTWTTIDCGARARKLNWARIYNAGNGQEAWVVAKALQRWQRGLPAGLPRCTGDAVPRHFVVLGDSYAAGIGAGSFLADSPGECYQSAKSYWAILGSHLAPGLVSTREDFEACSGDTTAKLMGKLGALNEDTRLVSVSIGGNDMHFSDIVMACVYPGGDSCKGKANDYFTPARLAKLRSDLGALYDAIRARAPNALVLVLGYPHLLHEGDVDGCGALDDGNANDLNDHGDELNDVIAAAVSGRKKFRYVGLVRTFRDHPACRDETIDWINGISNVAPDHKGSFHPDAQGNAAIALRLARAAPRHFR